ncbi:MAG: hypothetical protein ACI8UO_005467 [Verrucomicrobiales bacterium]|jgi:hypothetical protein
MIIADLIGETIKNALSHPLTWGLIAGFVFFGWLSWRYWMLKREFDRYRKHLSDKIETDGGSVQTLKARIQKLRKEKRSLQLKIGELNRLPGRTGRTAARDAEILTRAEKKLIVGEPDIATALELAKDEAMSELEEEEAGNRLPRRIHRAMTGVALKVEAENESNKEANSSNPIKAEAINC